MLKQKIISRNYLAAINLTLFTLVIASDQFYKYKIRQLGGFYMCNEGISFNIEVPYLTFWLTLALFLAFFVFFSIYKKNIRIKPLKITGILLILSGASSNLIDRFTYGCVIDHLNISKGFLPLFNLADIAISAGGLLLFIQLVFIHEVKK